MSDMLSSRQMARLLRKLPIHDGDVVLVKHSKFNEKDVMEGLRRAVETLDIGGIYVIMVDDFEDIKTFNRQEMNSHGWYHISQINRLTDRIHNHG